METNYVRENKEFLDNLEEKYALNGDGGVIKDGILCRGGVVYDNNGYWQYQEGDENTIWSNASRRILIVSKDSNGEQADINNETGRRNNSGADHISIPLRFHRNLMRFIYGFETITIEKMVSFDDFTLQDAIKAYDTAAVARINVKKVVGQNSISNSDLIQFICKYQDDIKKQIDILDPDIIICCSSVVFEKINEICFNNECIVNDDSRSWVHYIEGNRKRIIINSYHPSYIRIKEKRFYNEMMEDYYSFLQKHPDYISFR